MSLPTLDPGIDRGADLLAFDRDHLWHPYTSMTDPAPVRLVTGADGVRLHLDD
ncbi:MAG: adenosylmethionine--8-amino-7-oxononanoate aminotransferase BioA, partial [Actinomycetes bacterium]